jgi:hypothetical protein
MYLTRLREYAALTNSPILYCLTFRPETHRIGDIWAYKWLIGFVKYPGLVAFHPQSLKLILENLPKWKNPLGEKNDYELFLDGALPSEQVQFHQLALEASQTDAVLYRDEATKQWMLHRG